MILSYLVSYRRAQYSRTGAPARLLPLFNLNAVLPGRAGGTARPVIQYLQGAWSSHESHAREEVDGRYTGIDEVGIVQMMMAKNL